MAIKSFVGREPELQVLGSYISRISEAEQRRIVFITGEAGVGKSELIGQIRDKVFKMCPDIRLATAYCNELSGGGDPYQPFFNILDDLVTTEKREGKGKFLKFISEMGPIWVGAIPGIGSIVSAAWQTTQWVKTKTEHLNKAALDIPQIGYHMICRQYTKIIKSISTLNPLMLVVEDLQWADTSSIDLLFHLSRNLGSCPVLIICTYRPSEIEIRQHPVRQVKAEMERYGLCQEVSLAHLEKGNVTEYIKAEFPNNSFDRTFFDLLYNKTEGNPLFVVEALHLLEEQRIIVQRGSLWQLAKRVVDIDIPPAIAGVIEKRIGHLRNEIKRLLRYASIEGEIFSSISLARLLHWEELILLEELEVLENIHKLIEKLESEGLLTKSGMQYQFIHSLIHKSFYNSLNVRQKQLLHKKLGEILETEYRDDIEKIATQLAVHFEKALKFSKAIKYRVMAAKKSNDLYSFSECVEHCQVGLKLLDSLEDSNTTKQKIDLLIEWGKAEEAVGKIDEAISRYANCKVLALLIDNKRLSTVYYQWGSALYRKSNYGGSIDYLKKSLQLREELNDKAGIADALEAIGINYTYYQDRWHDALEVFERSQQIREELGDHRGKGRILGNIGVIYHKHGRDDDALMVCKEALTIQQQIGDVFGQALSLFTIGRVHNVRCEWNQALSYYRKSLELAEKIDDPMIKIEVLTGLGDWHRRQRKFSDAKVCFEDALKLSKGIGHKNGIAWLLCLIGRVMKEQSKTNEALFKLEESLKIYKEIGGWTGEAIVSKAMADVYMDTGDGEKAERLLKRALQIERNLETSRDILSTLLRLSKVYLAKRQQDRALSFISQLLVVAEQTGVPSDVSIIGDAQLTKARILLSKGDNQEALESVKSAHTIYKKLKLTTEIAETKIAEAEIMLATGGDRKKQLTYL